MLLPRGMLAAVETMLAIVILAVVVLRPLALREDEPIAAK